MALKAIVKFGYAVGHVVNDATSAIWFTYALIFFELVLEFSAMYAGLLVLLGQITDALVNPVIGYFCDQGPTICRVIDLRRRKLWYAVGSIGLIAAFPFQFFPCPGCSKSSDGIRFGYYMAVMTMFQISWACVQIAHLALASDLTRKKHERTLLMSLRTTFTILVALLVYFVTFLLFYLQKDGDIEGKINPKDITKFQILVLASLAVGAVACIFFFFTVNENVRRMAKTESLFVLTSSYRALLTDIGLYQVTTIYTCARIFSNVSQSLLPLYLNVTLQLDKPTIASIPFVMYVSSFIASLASAPINYMIGRKFTFLVGAIISFGAAVWIRFDTSTLYKSYFIYVITFLIGGAGALFLVTALAVIADHIGDDINNGAFIYGVVSLVDKATCGFVIMGIQGVRKHFGQMYYRDVLAYNCAMSTAIGLICIMTLKKRPSLGAESEANVMKTYWGRRKKVQKNETEIKPAGKKGLPKDETEEDL